MANKRKPVKDYPVGRAIAEALEKKGITQSELAARLNMEPGNLSAIIHDGRGVTSRMLVRIAIATGLDAFELGRMQSDYEIMKIIRPIIEKDREE